jgi:hypothetical protein
MSKPISKEKAREEFLDHVRHLAHYWSRIERDPLRMCEGVAFSILTAIDGSSALPTYDLVVRPHPDDKTFHENKGEDYYVDGMVINDDVHLHDMFYPACNCSLKDSLRSSKHAPACPRFEPNAPSR